MDGVPAQRGGATGCRGAAAAAAASAHGRASERGSSNSHSRCLSIRSGRLFSLPFYSDFLKCDRRSHIDEGAHNGGVGCPGCPLCGGPSSLNSSADGTEPRWAGLGCVGLAAGKKKNCRSRCGEGEALALLLAVAQGVSQGNTAGPTDSRKSAVGSTAYRSLRWCKKARKDSLLVTIVFPTYTFRQRLQTSDPLALTELFWSADNTRRSLQCLRRLLIFFRPPLPERFAALPALPASPISTSHPHQHT
ncbi:hypothetical protein L1887_58499 [Cichorium endivia]|nr:hypothetical protein L1887_58499 [Cichorium endivia]